MQTIRSEGERDKANFYLQLMVAVAVLVINSVMLAIISYVTIPTKNDAAFNIFLGNAMGWFGALIAFSFPNSIGSAKKDDTISKLADKAIPATEVLGGKLEGLNSTSAGAAGESISTTTTTRTTSHAAPKDSVGEEGKPDVPGPGTVDRRVPWD